VLGFPNSASRSRRQGDSSFSYFNFLSSINVTSILKEQYSTYTPFWWRPKKSAWKIRRITNYDTILCFLFWLRMSFFNLKEEKTLSQDSEYVNEEVPDVVAGPSWLKKCSRWTFFKFDYLPTDKVVIQNKPSLMCSHYSSELLKKKKT
jgi:hypothetical protein